MTNLDSILKSRDITLPTKVCLVKAMIFPVVMYGCESWTIKKGWVSKHHFEMWCWRRLLRVPWTARISNQSILSSQSYDFSSGHVWMWALGQKEGWVTRNWCFQTVVLTNTLEKPLDSKEIKPVNPEEYQSWYSLEGLMLKLKLQYFGHLMWRSPWCWERLKAGGKGDDKDEMVGWHHQLNGHEFEQALGVNEAQGRLQSVGS